MATDNRHRPGPPFRCPKCRCYAMALAAGEDLRRATARCTACGHTWLTRHKDALRALRAARQEVARAAR